MKTDFIVIGSGLAGLTSALTLERFGEVLLLTKAKLTDSATNLAQGGIAAVVSSADTYDLHIKDTLVAGVYHNKKSAVEFLVRHGQDAIQFLEREGVVFDKINGQFETSFEGAHSYPRVVHAGDFTGHSIEKTLVKRVRERKNITIWEDAYVTELMVRNGRCIGVEVVREENFMHCFSRATILATGGLGSIFAFTTNPTIATGDGIALAYRAGAQLKDLEFIQFHPTALRHGQSPLFLLSEALRGEGGYLVNSLEERFMLRIHPRAELAPRDIVARAIFAQQKKSDVFLDMRHKGKTFLQTRFPNIFREALARGYDLSSDLVPVTPAQHYSCGGVEVDLFGRTTIQGLFAFGEVSCTGVHGANRLASNSLLEAMVFPLRLPEVIGELPTTVMEVPRKISHHRHTLVSPGSLSTLARIMWECVGIVRTKKGLREAILGIHELEKSVKNGDTSRALLEFRTMLTGAKLVAEAALRRSRSLGAHHMLS